MTFIRFKPKYDDNTKKQYVLYHVSLEGNLDPHHFVPRIPQRSLETEDKTIPRICAAHDINDCISGCPDGYTFFTEKTVLGSAFLYVYEINTLEIGGTNIRLHHELLGLVPDAYKTKESWILTEFTCKPKIYRFENMEYETTPRKGIRYRDIVVGRDNMDFIMQNHNNIINFDKRDNNSYYISYFADDDTIKLWDEIAWSHKEYREQILNQVLHYQ